MNLAAGRSRVRGLYAIADTGILAPDRLLTAVRQAISGGARIIQYRDKSGDAEIRRMQALVLCDLCHELGAILIINDDVALAKSVNADGVHLGRHDPHIVSARARLGDDAIIGVSCYNEIERARKAGRDGADYVAFGSFYSSSVKPEAVRASSRLLQQAKVELDLPVVAIGGITPDNGAELVAAGADALAVITGVFGAENIREAAEKYSRLFVQKSSEGSN
jgi:thiamine-phosphate pyrophosphorylase